MRGYHPKFTISPKSLNLVSEISILIAKAEPY